MLKAHWGKGIPQSWPCVCSLISDELLDSHKKGIPFKVTVTPPESFAFLARKQSQHNSAEPQLLSLHITPHSVCWEHLSHLPFPCTITARVTLQTQDSQRGRVREKLILAPHIQWLCAVPTPPTTPSLCSHQHQHSPPLFAASTASAGSPNWLMSGPSCPEAKAALNMLKACGLESTASK